MVSNYPGLELAINTRNPFTVLKYVDLEFKICACSVQILESTVFNFDSKQLLVPIFLITGLGEETNICRNLDIFIVKNVFCDPGLGQFLWIAFDIFELEKYGMQAKPYLQAGAFEIVDERLKGSYDLESMQKTSSVASRAVERDASQRPTMAQVLAVLKEAYSIQLSYLSSIGHAN